MPRIGIINQTLSARPCQLTKNPEMRTAEEQSAHEHTLYTIQYTDTQLKYWKMN